MIFLKSIILLAILFQLEGCEQKAEVTSHPQKNLDMPNIIRPIRNGDNKYGFVNQKGEVIIEPKYDYASTFSDGLAAVKIDSKWGFINEAGNLVIEPKFDETIAFKDGIAWVKAGGKWGTLNKKGKFYEFPYDVVDHRGEKYSTVTANGKRGIIARNGSVVIGPKYDDLFFMYTTIGEAYEHFDREGLVWAKVDEKWGLLNRSNLFVIEPHYDRVGYFTEWDLPYFKVEIEQYQPGRSKYRMGLVDRETGKLVLEPIIEDWQRFLPSRDLIIVQCYNGKWGMLDRSLKFRLEPVYDFIDDLTYGGIARVRRGNKWGIIDKNAGIVVEPRYDNIEAFDNGVAKAILNNRDGKIDYLGNFTPLTSQ